MTLIHGGWPYQPDLCPSDDDFIEAIQNLRGNLIFHMGPGLHHKVGIAANQQNNHVLAATISQDEVNSYVDLLVSQPDLAYTYQVMFRDLYWLGAELLPMWFDIITLFHLGETPEPARGLGSENNIMSVLVDKLKRNGYLYLYKGSFGFARVEDCAHRLEMFGTLEHSHDFKSLRAYRKI